MTQPELDTETKARIEAEEAYRAEVRGRHTKREPLNLGFIGSFLLAAGTFAPAVSLPLAGSVNLIGAGDRDGVILLGLAVLSVLFVFTAQNWLIFTGICSAAFLTLKLLDFNRLTQASDLAELGWGWIPMVGGAILILISGVKAVR